jgi:hypothetical protein
VADDVFEAVGAAGDHEVGRAHEGKEAHFVAPREADGRRGFCAG